MAVKPLPVIVFTQGWQVATPLPAVTHEAAGLAQTVRVPEVAPHLLLAEAVVIHIGRVGFALSHNPVPVF